MASVVAACAGAGPSLGSAETEAVAPAPTATPPPTPTAAPVPTPTPLPTPTPTPTPEPDCVPDLTDSVLIGQLLMPLATPGDLADAATLAADRTIGAIGLLGAPTAQQIVDLRANADDEALPLLIASDEEGGRVQRLAAATVALPSAAAQVALGPDAVHDLFADHGARLRELGVDMALAPVVDVGGGPGIGDRAYGSEPQQVIDYARAVSEGYLAGGVTPVLKHFPGHGSASQDTHDGIATTPALAELRGRDLVPFEILAAELGDAAGVMIGHLLVPGLTEDLPTSLSPDAITGLLRGEIGFDGFVITDALGMGAIAARWDQPAAALLAIRAGADMVILGDLAAVGPTRERLLGAVASRELPRAQVEAAVTRVLALKGVDPCAVAGALASS